MGQGWHIHSDALDSFLESAINQRPVGQIAWESGFERGGVLAPLVFSRREFDDGPTAVSPLFESIQREGVAA